MSLADIETYGGDDRKGTCISVTVGERPISLCTSDSISVNA